MGGTSGRKLLIRQSGPTRRRHARARAARLQGVPVHRTPAAGSVKRHYREPCDVSDVITFESDDLGVRFELDARYQQTPPLRSRPAFTCPARHFTLSMPRPGWRRSTWSKRSRRSRCARRRTWSARSRPFSSCQRHWDLSRRGSPGALSSCDPGRPARLAHGARHRSAPLGESEFDPAQRVPVYTRQYALFDGRPYPRGPHGAAARSAMRRSVRRWTCRCAPSVERRGLPCNDVTVSADPADLPRVGARSYCLTRR